MPQIKVGIIGTGVMGGNHIRVAGRNSAVDLVAVCDSDIERLNALEVGEDVELLLDPSKMLDICDGIIIATPTEYHSPLGKLCLEAGVPCLIEKPLASTVSDGEELIALSKKNNTVLMAGHIERFNSAVLALPEFLKDPFHFEFRRISPFSPRVRESIVTDLMIHDLELLLHLNPAQVTSIQTIGQSRKTEWADSANVLLTFDDGSTAHLSASRIGQQKIRSIEISQSESVVHADLLRQDVTISKVDHVEFSTEGGMRYRQSGVLEVPFIQNNGEPLMVEQMAFADAVEKNDLTLVSPESALAALKLAFEIDSQIPAFA